MRTWITLCGAALFALTGCPVEPETGMTVEVRNSSDFDARLLLEADGRQISIAADPAGEVLENLSDCPMRLVLREVTLRDDPLELANAIVGGELAAGSHYECGDRIVIEISDGRARLFTLAE